jgi:hypothetical protein
MFAVSQAVYLSPQCVLSGMYRVSLIEEAKRWLEVAAVICRHVPNGQKRAEKVSSFRNPTHISETAKLL